VVSDAARLADRVYRKLDSPVEEALPMAFHRAAVNTMLMLRDVLMNLTQAARPESRMALLCAGVKAHRRAQLRLDDEATLEQLATTIPLLFVLVVMSHGPKPKPSRSASSSPVRNQVPDELGGPLDMEAIDDDSQSPGNDSAEPAAKRPKTAEAPPEPEPETELSVEAKLINAWQERCLTEQLASAPDSDLTPESVCRSVLIEARNHGQTWDFEVLRKMAASFFQCSSQTMQHQMLQRAAAAPDASSEGFLTLETVGFLKQANEQRLERLAAIANIAESEAGQQVMRDMILSFTLPNRVVGVRRTALIKGTVQQEATANYPVIVNDAHDAAMRGADWEWEHSTIELHKMSTLLAGLAIMLASKTQDAVRKEDAFSGRVGLPFLETKPPAQGLRCIALIPSKNEWIVYALNKKNKPKIQFRKPGFEGFCQSVLLFTAAEKGL
tara:strand:- start:1584 stop:2906 length:1323 start_codon:yes stop_codon:yes gene_type:complete